MPVDSPSQAETLVRRLYEPLATGSSDVVDDVVAPGWDVQPPLEAGPGADGWKTAVAHIRSVLGDLTLTVEDVVAAGDKVAVRLVMRGIQRGELLGVPATGREVEIRASDFHQIADGRIVRSWHLEDFFGALQQLNAASGGA